jgi:hypothetical protein
MSALKGTSGTTARYSKATNVPGKEKTNSLECKECYPEGFNTPSPQDNTKPTEDPDKTNYIPQDTEFKGISDASMRGQQWKEIVNSATTMVNPTSSLVEKDESVPVLFTNLCNFALGNNNIRKVEAVTTQVGEVVARGIGDCHPAIAVGNFGKTFFGDGKNLFGESDPLGAILGLGFMFAELRALSFESKVTTSVATAGTVEVEAANNGEQLFEVADGVRRSKAAQLLGYKTIDAIDNTGMVFKVSIKNLRSPFKSSIDISTPLNQIRYDRIYNGLKAKDKIPPIYVNPGTRGVKITDITFIK